MKTLSGVDKSLDRLTGKDKPAKSKIIVEPAGPGRTVIRWGKHRQYINIDYDDF